MPAMVRRQMRGRGKCQVTQIDIVYYTGAGADHNLVAIDIDQ